MEDTLGYLEMIGFAALLMLYFLHAKLEKLLGRMGQIEEALGIETELKRASKIDPDVEAKIREGKINQAIRLHRSRYQITGKEAELIVKRYASTMT